MKKILLLIGIISSLLSYSQPIKISLNDSITYQEIVGFGWHGSMNVWWGNGPFYNDTYLNNVVDDLGMTINRNNFYSYDMSQYTNKQKAYYIALKNKAEASGEPMKFIQTVWSPPTEWKQNKKVCDETCSSLCNAQFDLNEKCTSTKNILLPEYYDDYVNFCTDYIKQLKTETGVDMYAFSLQNESAFNEPYESCVYTPETYNNLLKVAGPIFASKCPDVKLFGPEDMGSASTTAKWTGVIFNDPVTKPYLDIVAVHGYQDGVAAATGDATGWSSMYSNVNANGKELWMTETSGYSSSWTGAPGAFDVVKAMYVALKYGKISAWVWWQFGSSTMTSDKIYYVFKNYFRYIRPGSVQIESSSPDKDVFVLAFKHHGNSSYSAIKPQLSVILINNTTGTKTVSLNGRNIPTTMKAYQTSSSQNCVTLADANTSSISLPAQSITTLVYQSTNKGPTINQSMDVAVVKSSTSKTISLSNITNGEGSQTGLTVTAICNNKAVIPGTISVTPGTGGNYTLNYTPSGIGTANIKVFVKDNGTDMINMTVMEFTIKVIPFINAAPNVNAISDYVCGYNNKTKKHYIYFSGVNDGNDGSQKVQRPVLTFSDASIVRLPYVNYTINETGGKIEFYPDKIGSTTVTMKVFDDGGTDIGGKDAKEITFKITVEAEHEYVDIVNHDEETMKVYPNPADEFVNIEFSDIQTREIEIIDLTGKIVFYTQQSTDIINISTSQFSEGIYIILAKGESNVSKSKISIKRK